MKEELIKKYNHLKEERDELEYRLARIQEDKTDLYQVQEEYDYDGDQDGAKRIQNKLDVLLKNESELKAQLSTIKKQMKELND